VVHPLAVLIADAAAGRFPAVDGGWRRARKCRQPPCGHDGRVLTHRLDAAVPPRPKLTGHRASRPAA